MKRILNQKLFFLQVATCYTPNNSIPYSSEDYDSSEMSILAFSNEDLDDLKSRVLSTMAISLTLIILPIIVIVACIIFFILIFKTSIREEKSKKYEMVGGLGDTAIDVNLDD